MDNALLPEILNLCRAELEQKDYVFSFNVTYQNHGPYPADEERFTEVYVPAERLDSYGYTIANNYLHGVEDTGNQLLALAEALNQEEAPYLLVFFGDHKPWLGDQHSVYTALGIDLDSGSEQSVMNYYCTEYLIWANDAAREKLGDNFTGEGPMISPCYLMNEVFDRCGWAGPSYMKLSRRIQTLLPVLGTKGSYVTDGQLIRSGQLTDQAKAAIRLMEDVTYYLMRESNGQLPAANK